MLVLLGDAPDVKSDFTTALSDKSITAEQWKTFDMIADSYVSSLSWWCIQRGMINC